MKITISKKMSGTGSIHDVASEHFDRVIEGRGSYAVVLASYYGGKGYTTHKSEEAAVKQAVKIGKAGYSYQIFDAEGNQMAVDSDGLLAVMRYADEDKIMTEGMKHTCSICGGHKNASYSICESCARTANGG